MICPLASTVDETLRDPAAIDLIDADGRAGIAALARRLPDVMHGFGFELRLSPRSAAVDFYTSIAGGGGGREAWTRSALALGDGTPAQAEAWQRVAALARQWADPATALHRQIAMVFLEFDAPFGVGQPPSVFARLDTAIGDGQAQWAAAAPAVDELALALLGRRAPDGTRERLAAAVRALPAGGRIVDVAAMLPRGQVAVRLFLNLPRAGLADYLRGLGWTEGQGDLARVLETVFARCPYVSLQIDVGEAVGPRIGVELGPSATGDGDGWNAIGERLRRVGLADGDQVAALGRWVGVGPARSIGGRWPSQAVRLISHVKVVVEPSRPIESKAYLWATRRFAQLGG